MSAVTYDGVLAGLVGGSGSWEFEGREYETPADEASVMGAVEEALAEPGRAEVKRARDFVFGGGAGANTYTAGALLAMLVAYEQECDGGEGVEAVASILREAARRIAVIEALTV